MGSLGVKIKLTVTVRPGEPFFLNEEIIGELPNRDDSIAKFFTKPASSIEVVILQKPDKVKPRYNETIFFALINSKICEKNSI